MSSAPVGSLSGTLPGSRTRLLVVQSKWCPTAGLKLPVGRHNEQQERRENRRRTRQADVFAELEVEVHFEAQLWRLGKSLRGVGSSRPFSL
jgi:hypothetical protein